MSHPQLMREIIPMSVLHKLFFSFEDLVKAKNYKLRHNNAPAFLYGKELWDPDNPDSGLFKGHFPILVLHQILFSLKAATSASGSQMTGTHRNNTEISGVNKVTPDMLASMRVAHLSLIFLHILLLIVQIFAGSLLYLQARTVRRVGEDFSFRSFYYWIVKLFEEADEDWVQDTLTYRNDKNFGPADDQDIEDDEDEDDETCFTNILALQRAWKAQQSA
ncbi:hypothetical protein ACEPAF_8637 [Sanghuangporus sanghuang]